MRVAVVDDDPVEHLILTELTRALKPEARVEGFTRLEDFIDAQPDRFDIVFLDRRLPPHDAYSQTLPRLEEAGYGGHVVLMTAHDDEVRKASFGFRVTGPVDKIELIRGERLSDILSTRPT